VLNGATCDATVHTGCGQAPAAVTVGDDPRGLAVDPVTDTVYVANHAEGDFAGTVSVINGATCNGTDHTGCGQPPAQDAVGNYPSAIGIGTVLGTAYVSNLDNTVSVVPLRH